MRLDQVVTNEKATPRDWGFGKSKNKGTPLFWMEFELPEFTASDGSASVTITHNWYLTDKTLDFVLRDLALLGWNGSDVSELDKANGGKHSFFNQIVNITTMEEAYQNDKGESRKSIKIKYFNDPAYAPSMQAMETKELKGLGAKIKGKIAAYRTKNPVVANGKKAEPVFAEKEKDEVPF